MKFELTNYNHQKKYSDEELIADLRKVAANNGGDISSRLYDKNGQYGTTTLIERFGGWNEALKAASHTTNAKNIKIPNEVLLDDLRKVAKDNAGKVSMKTYDENGEFSRSSLARRFGSWNKALKAADIEPVLFMNISDDILFENLEKVRIKLGRQPKRDEMTAPLSKFHVDTYVNRYGTWTKALEKFIEFVNREPAEEELNSSPEDAEPISDPEVTLNVKNDIADVAQAIEVTPEIFAHIDEVIKHKTKRDPNLRLRWHVYNRDKFRCVACGRSPAKDIGVELHVDHIKPWSKGGETVLDNLQTLCATCNLGKGNIE